MAGHRIVVTIRHLFCKRVQTTQHRHTGRSSPYVRVWVCCCTVYHRNPVDYIYTFAVRHSTSTLAMSHLLTNRHTNVESTLSRETEDNTQQTDKPFRFIR